MHFSVCAAELRYESCGGRFGAVGKCRLLWEEMKKIAVEIAKEGFVMESSSTNVPYDVMQELEGLRSEVAVLGQLVIGQACAPPR